MRAYNVTLQAEIEVKFTNWEKAHAFFIEGTWRESFFDFDHISDVAKHIAATFNWESDKWSVDKEGSHTYRFLEGFGEFYRQPDGTYKNGDADGDAGAIIVRSEDVDAEYCEEI